MTKETVNVDVEHEEHPTHPPFRHARKLMLAAIGAASLARDAMVKNVNRMAEHGEVVEKDARQLVREMVDKKEKLAEEKFASRTKPMETQPVEITQLKEQIEALKAEIEDLKKHVES